MTALEQADALMRGYEALMPCALCRCWLATVELFAGVGHAQVWAPRLLTLGRGPYVLSADGAWCRAHRLNPMPMEN